MLKRARSSPRLQFELVRLAKGTCGRGGDEGLRCTGGEGPSAWSDKSLIIDYISQDDVVSLSRMHN